MAASSEVWRKFSYGDVTCSNGVDQSHDSNHIMFHHYIALFEGRAAVGFGVRIPLLQILLLHQINEVSCHLLGEKGRFVLGGVIK